MADSSGQPALDPAQQVAAFEAQISALEAQIGVIHQWIMDHVAGNFPAPPVSKADNDAK